MYFMMSLCIIIDPYFRSKRYCPLLESLQVKYNCFEKEIEFFLYVYKFRSVKVIELIFTYTVSKFMVISFNLNRKWLKGPDTNGKTVQLVDVKYVCIVTWNRKNEESRFDLIFRRSFFTISSLRHRIANTSPNWFLLLVRTNFTFKTTAFNEYEISLAWLRSRLFQIIWNLRLLS